MYSVNASNGTMRISSTSMSRRPEHGPDLHPDETGIRPRPSFPLTCRNYGVTIQKSRGIPLMILALYSPKGTLRRNVYGELCNINLNDQLLPGARRCYGFDLRAGQYAIRVWVKPDTLLQNSASNRP